MVFSATFNNISVILGRSVLLVEETGGPGENHRPVASRRQTFGINCRLFCINWGRRGRDRMVVGFTTTCAISAYHH
jgi:hypothetical protein